MLTAKREIVKKVETFFFDNHSTSLPSWQKDIKRFKTTLKDHTPQFKKETTKNYREIYYTLEIPDRSKKRAISQSASSTKREACFPVKWEKSKKLTALNGNIIIHSITLKPMPRILKSFSMFEHNIHTGYNKELLLSFPHHLALIALEKINQTGRLIAYYENTNYYRQKPRTLTFSSEAYSFRAKIDSNDNDDSWKLTGEFYTGNDKNDKRVAWDLCRIIYPANFMIYADVLSPFTIPNTLVPLFHALENQGSLEIPKKGHKVQEELKALIHDMIGIENTDLPNGFGMKKALVQGTPLFTIEGQKDHITGSLLFEYFGDKFPPLSEELKLPQERQAEGVFSRQGYGF